MAPTPNFDVDQWREEAAQLRDTAAVYAGKVAVKAADLVGAGVDWAAPRAQAALTRAIDRAAPAVESAAARAKSVVEHAGPAIESARANLVEDYLPRASRAVNQAGNALSAPGPLSERARRAKEVSTVALTTPTPKVRKRRFLRAVGLAALAATAAGVGYVLWKRSQPIEDPWAEEYWADLETDAFVPDSEAEQASLKSGE